MKAWDDITTQGLVGTERQGFAAPQTTGAIHKAMSRISDETPEGRLLSAAALVHLSSQAGSVLSQAPASRAPIAPEEELPLCSWDAGQILLRFFTKEEGMVEKHSTRLVVEWLDLAEKARCLAPPACLPSILMRGEYDQRLRARIIQQHGHVLGRRLAWLAQRNPDWAYAARSTQDSCVWEEGASEERRTYLTRLRSNDPDAARTLLAANWSQETAEDRKEFLGAFATGLSLADENFLEAALDDRGKSVRRAAAELLSCLPQSGLAQRMIRRLSQCVRVEKRFLGGRKLVVEAPDQVDDSMKRDTIEARQNAPKNMGMKGYALNQIVALTPLAEWSAGGEVTPEEMIVLARATDWAYPIVNGLSQAAISQRNGTWLRALMGSMNKEIPECDQKDLLAALPVDDLLPVLNEILKDGGCSTLTVEMVYLLLRNEALTLDVATTKRILCRVPRAYAPVALDDSHNPSRSEFLGLLATKVDPHCQPEAHEAAREILERKPKWTKETQGFLEIVELRHAMHKEMSQ